MFYWSYRDVHVVLSDEEKQDLFQECGSTARERIGRAFDPKVNKRLNKRADKYLRAELARDADEFHRRYQYRNREGEEAVAQLRIFLDGYGRITRRAVLGQYGGPRETGPMEAIHEAIEPYVQVTLLRPPRFFFGAKPIGRISIPVSTIGQVVGQVDDFLVITNTMRVHFGREFIRITAHNQSLLGGRKDAGATTEDRPYPAPDRSNQTYNGDRSVADVGWHEGVLADGRPFRMECWAEDGVTSLTFFFSTRGLETCSRERLIDLLVESEVLTFLSADRFVGAAQFRDAAGETMWSVNVVIADEDAAYSDSPLPLRGYPRES